MKKRVFSFALCFVLLLSLAVFPTQAADSIAEHLIIHYDFEGDTDAERLLDKAPAGKVADNLVNFGQTGGIVVENGMATSAVSSAKSVLYAPASDDILATGQGEGTWFFRFRSTCAGTLLDLRQNSVGRPLYLSLKSDGNLELFQAGIDNPAGYVKVGTVALGYDFAEAKWCNLFVRRYLKSGEYYYYQVFFSYDNGVNFSSSSEFLIGNKTNGLVPTAYPLALYSQYFSNSSSLWPIADGLTLDDVRYYDINLGWAGMTEVIQKSSFGTPVRDLNKAMTIHYDFEGDTVAEALKDKAVYGNSADDLTIYGSESGYTFEDGKVTSVSGAKNIYAAASLDLKKANEGEGTWFIRFSSTNAADQVLLDFRDNSVSRPLYLLLESDGQFTFHIGTTGSSSTYNYKDMEILGAPYAFDGTVVNLALVRVLEPSNSYYYYKFYYSFGDSAEFVYSNIRLSNNLTTQVSAEGICCGLFNNPKTTWGANSGLTYDDVRYYTVALAEDELGRIISEDICARSRIYGYQVSADYTNDSSAEVYDLRLIATIDTADLAGAGFFVTLGDQTVDLPVSCCFSSLLAKDTDTGNMTQVTAPEGTYFIAVVIKNIPSTTLPTLNVQPYITETATPIGGAGSAFTVTK